MEDIKDWKRIRLMEENNDHDMKKEIAKIDDNDENQHDFNDQANNNNNNNQIHMNHERDFEKVENVLAPYKSDIHKCISSKKLGQEMFRIGVGVAKRKTFLNGTQPYCYVGIKLKDKKENDLVK